MNKRLKATAVCIALMTLACEKPMTAAQKTAMLDAERRQVYADLERHMGECRAVTVEFPGDAKLRDGCLETHRFMVDNARLAIEVIDKRISEIERTGR